MDLLSHTENQWEKINTLKEQLTNARRNARFWYLSRLEHTRPLELTPEEQEQYDTFADIPEKASDGWSVETMMEPI